MTRQPFKTLRHIDELMHLRIRLVHRAQLRTHLQCLVDRHIKRLRSLRHHLRDRITQRIRKIHHAPHITDHTARRHRTESDDLHHTILAVLSHYVINDLLTPFKTKVNINIRHRHTLRI